LVKAPQDGAVHITAGSGGQLSSSYGLNHPAHFYAVREYGSVVIDVNGGTMEVKFLRETGAVDDYFTLTKDVSVGGLPGLPAAGPFTLLLGIVSLLLCGVAFVYRRAK
jgi:hypothetical protein